MIKGTVNGIWIILKLLWLMLTSWFSSSFASFATLVTICNWNSSTAAICCVHIYLSVEIDHGTLQLFVFTVLILLQLFVFTVSILPLYNISICWTMIPYTTILQWKVFVQQWVAWLLCQPVSQSVSGHKMSTLSELGMFAASCCKGQVTNKKKKPHFTNKNPMKSCEKQGFLHSVQIIKQNHTLISIFPTIIYGWPYKLDSWPGACELVARSVKALPAAIHLKTIMRSIPFLNQWQGTYFVLYPRFMQVTKPYLP